MILTSSRKIRPPPRRLRSQLLRLGLHPEPHRRRGARRLRHQRCCRRRLLLLLLRRLISKLLLVSEPMREMQASLLGLQRLRHARALRLESLGEEGVHTPHPGLLLRLSELWLAKLARETGGLGLDRGELLAAGRVGEWALHHVGLLHELAGSELLGYARHHRHHRLAGGLRLEALHLHLLLLHLLGELLLHPGLIDLVQALARRRHLSRNAGHLGLQRRRCELTRLRRLGS